MYESCDVDLTLSDILTQCHDVYNPHRIQLNIEYYICNALIYMTQIKLFSKIKKNTVWLMIILLK